MKVLFICSGNSGYRPNIIIRNQGNSLISKGIELQYFLIKGRGLLSYLRHIYLLKRERRKYSFCLFHAHYSFSGLIAALAGCKPLVVSLMGSDTKKNLFWKSLIRFFSKYFWDTTIVKSLSTKKEAGLESSVIIPNGVDLDKVKPSARNRDDKNKIVLFASNPGRISKNYQLAKDAIDMLDDKNISLRIVHSRPHEEVVREINNADILLVTSRWEGSPNIVKEAMACNCPVVATKVGDIEWLFGTEGGYYVTSFKAEDVAEKIKLALDFAEKHGPTNGRERIIELKLDSIAIAGQIINLYRKVLEIGK